MRGDCNVTGGKKSKTIPLAYLHFKTIFYTSAPFSAWLPFIWGRIPIIAMCSCTSIMENKYMGISSCVPKHSFNLMFLFFGSVKGRKIWQRQLMAGEKCSDMGKKRIYASTQWHARRHHNSDHFCPMFSPDTSSVCDNLTLGDRFTVQNVKKKRMWILLVQLFTWNGNLSSETVDPFTKVLGRTQRPGSR